jgi:hypothetical protein
MSSDRRQNFFCTTASESALGPVLPRVQLALGLLDDGAIFPLIQLNCFLSCLLECLSPYLFICIFDTSHDLP